MRNKPHSRYVAILLSLLLLFALSSCDLSGLQRNMLITPQGSEEVNKVITDTVTNIQTSQDTIQKPTDIISNIPSNKLPNDQKEKVNSLINTIIEDSGVGDINIITPVSEETKNALLTASDTDLANLNAAYSAVLDKNSPLKESVSDTVSLIYDALEKFSGDDSMEGGGSSGTTSGGFNLNSIFSTSVVDEDGNIKEGFVNNLTVGDAVALQIVSDVVFNELLPAVAPQIDDNGSLPEDFNFEEFVSSDSAGEAINGAVSSLRLIDKLDTTIFAPNMISNLISNLTNNSSN